jgi:hypothetical protein
VHQAPTAQFVGRQVDLSGLLGFEDSAVDEQHQALGAVRAGGDPVGHQQAARAKRQSELAHRRRVGRLAGFDAPPGIAQWSL